jgi:hypothetical protein
MNIKPNSVEIIHIQLEYTISVLLEELLAVDNVVG